MTLFRIIKDTRDGASWEKSFFRKNQSLARNEKGNVNLSVTKYNVTLSLGTGQVNSLIEQLTGFEDMALGHFEAKGVYGKGIIEGYHFECPPRRGLTHVTPLTLLLENFIAYEIGSCVHQSLDYQRDQYKNNIEVKFIEKKPGVVYDIPSAKAAAHNDFDANILCLNIHLVFEEGYGHSRGEDLHALWVKFAKACQTTEAQNLFYSTTNNFKVVCKGYRMAKNTVNDYEFYMSNRRLFISEPSLSVKPLSRQGAIPEANNKALIYEALSLLSASFASFFPGTSESSSSSSSSSSRSYSYSSDEE